MGPFLILSINLYIIKLPNYLVFLVTGLFISLDLEQQLRESITIEKTTLAFFVEQVTIVIIVTFQICDCSVYYYHSMTNNTTHQGKGC